MKLYAVKLKKKKQKKKRERFCPLQLSSEHTYLNFLHYSLLMRGITMNTVLFNNTTITAKFAQ